MSLQLAVKYENAVLDVEVLHEAAVMNRKYTIDALDELKQRILLREPMPRALSGPPRRLSDTQFSIDSMSSVRSSRSSICTHVPDDHVRNTFSHLSEGAPQDEKTALARYFAGQSRDSSSISPTTPNPPAPSQIIHTHPALEHLLQGKGPTERAAIMKDIDEIISAYQCMSVDGDRAEALAMLTGGTNASKRDTLAVLNGGGFGYQRGTMDLNRDALRLLGKLPPASGVSHENSEYVNRVYKLRRKSKKSQALV